MTERDEELRATLRLWKTPAPTAQLDERVWNEFRENRQPGRRRWLAAAAGVLLVAGAAAVLHSGPARRRGPRIIETRVDAAGFRAVTNGTITVVEAEGHK